MLRVEFDEGGGAETVGLLAAGNQRLSEQAADGFASEKPKKAGTSGQAEKLLRIRRAQPLKIQREIRLVKLFTHRISGKGMGSQGRRRRFEGRNCLSVEGSEPA